MYLKKLQFVIKITNGGGDMIKRYFDDNGINLKKFAQKHKLDYMSLFRVVNGLYTQKYKAKTNTRSVYEKLFELKIIDKMPEVCA